MSEQADNILESPLQQQLSHHLNHHNNSNNTNSHIHLQQQHDEEQQQHEVQNNSQQEIVQLTNVTVETSSTEDLNQNNNLNSGRVVVDGTSNSKNSTQPGMFRRPLSSECTPEQMAGIIAANALAAAAAAAKAAAAAAAASSTSSSINNINSNSNSMAVSSGATATLSSSNRRSNNNLNHSNLVTTNSIINNNNNNNSMGAGNSDGNHLSIHRVIQKSRDCHPHQHHHHLQNSANNDENVGNIVVGDVGVIIGEATGDEENVIIGHGTASGNNDDDFQLQLHHHHNILVHENEIEIGNVVEQDSMQHHEEVILGNPIVIKTEAGEHEISGATVTVVSADDFQQQQIHHISVAGRDSNSGMNGPNQDGTRGMQASSHHHHHHHAGTNIITIPVLGSLPYTVITDADPNGPSTSRISGTGSQDQVHTSTPRGGGRQSTTSHVTATTSHSATTTPQTSFATSSFCNSHLTWEEAVSAPILPIRCKDTNAELYKTKFGSGNKGKCIKTGNEWFTPTEFEALCGRGNSKDWKRSIRFGGRTLQTLIDKGFLVPHASSCICSNCVDDATATGPIRPFTPYQRKRKSQSGNALKVPKLERLTSKDSNTDESSDIGTPGTPLITSGLNPLSHALMKANSTSLPACNDDAWKVVEDGVERIVSAATSLKSLVQEMRERTGQELEELRSQLQNSIQTVVQNPVVGHPQILRIFDSNRIQTYSIEVLDPESFKPMETSSGITTKCDNCGREGSLECSGCHSVHYCSSFCQKKDWPTHQAACQDRGTIQVKEEII